MPELIVILVIILIIFGAGKLPQIGEGIGKGIRNFKKATKDQEEIDVTPKKTEEIPEKKWNVESLFTPLRMEHIAYIGIGSNLGDKVGQCEKAISEILKTDHHKLLARSSLFKTKPLGYPSQDWFINGVIKIKTDLEPLELLRLLKNIESRLGRKKTFQWGPRAIDLDILFFDEKQIQVEGLQIPHPFLQERQFVLIPLAEIDRALIHPVLKKSIGELLDNLTEDQGVEKI